MRTGNAEIFEVSTDSKCCKLEESVLGAMKRGRCTCVTFKAFNLTYLPVLRS